MPQVMTPEEALKKMCPFIAYRDKSGWRRCVGDECACWGWVDGEEGQIDHRNSETTSTNVGEPPEGDGWLKVGHGIVKQVWKRAPVIGPRRGQCEAMSPYIEVTGP